MILAPALMDDIERFESAGNLNLFLSGVLRGLAEDRILLNAPAPWPRSPTRDRG